MDFNRYCNEQSLKTPYNNNFFVQKCTYEENQMNLIFFNIK